MNQADQTVLAGDFGHRAGNPAWGTTSEEDVLGPASRPLTEQQGRAVSCREVSVVLSSGAGCGKTHVLTERYLAHLRDGDMEVGQVVAITFTDRAARQMRQRIRQAIAQELRAAPSDDAAERWARHLRGLESAPISTIHAFCGNLLRQHAIDAGLDPRFEILEDVLSLNLEAEALTDCLQRLLTAETTEGQDLRQLILLYGWRPTVTAIEHLMQTDDPSGWESWRVQAAEATVATWQRLAGEILRPRYVRHVLVTAPKIAHCLNLLGRVAPRPDSEMALKVRRLLELVPQLAEVPDLAAAVTELKECAKVGKEREKAWPSAAAYEEIKAAFEDFREELPGRLQLFTAPSEDLTAAAVVGQRFLRVAAQAAEAYRESKRYHGVVDFQDLLILARDLLRDRSEVRERLQRRYKVLLIDELQDTDPVQIELVELLCGGGLATGKLFAVGDHKQSIYRFRGADVSRFQDLRRRVPHEGRLDLTVNFRSQPAILDFTNALLGDHLTEYEPLVAHHAQVNPGPCVEFLWSPRGDKELVNEARATEADWIARRVAALVAGEALVVDRLPDGPRLRPVRLGDVVLLFRAMTNVHLYEAALRHYGLDYYLVGGRAFFAQQEIYDLLNLLRALENPQDAVSLAGTLRSPFCCLSDEALFLLNRHPEGLWAGLHDPATAEKLPADQRADAGRARHFLDRWRGLKDRLPIARLLGEVFADSGYDAATQFEFLGDRKLANLWKLMDLARTFDRSGLFGLAQLIQRLDDLVRTQPREEQAATQPENADVVRLMSIHQAKGLEFPVVCIPDVAAVGGGAHYPVAHWDRCLGCVVRSPTDEDPPPFPSFSWDLWKAAEALEEWHEDLRTLYVACTRAQDYLLLSAALPADYRPANAWMGVLSERFGLRSGACRVAGIPAERIPAVRVTSDLASPQPAAPRLPQSSPDGEPAATLVSRLAPIPVRLTGPLVLTVTQVENCLRRPEAPDGDGPVPLRPEDVAVQFQTEDGSDRTAWVSPRQRIDPAGDGEDTEFGRALRSVLEGWDFRDSEGWKKILSESSLGRTALRSRPDGSGEPSYMTDSRAAAIETADLERVLTKFAASPTYRQLAAACRCWRNVEFLTGIDLSPSEDGGRKVLVRGLIDCLWQDKRGSWHVLAYAFRRPPGRGRDAEWRCREASLVLAARAVEQDQGTWPKSVTVYSFARGVAVRRPGDHLRAPEIMERITAGLSDWLGQPLAESHC